MKLYSIEEKTISGQQVLERTYTRASKLSAFALVGGLALGLTGCGSPEGEATEPATTPSEVVTEGAEQGLPGTIFDGSDEAIMADVEAGITNCGGQKNELWTDKPYSPNHMFNYYDQNPKMVDATEAFWVENMGREALEFLVENGYSNNESDDALSIADNEFMTQFTRKHIANSDVLGGTVEINHNCVDTNGDGTADTIVEWDLRVAPGRDSADTLEKSKRQTLAGIVLTQEDATKFFKTMQENGKNPDDLVHYPISLDLNGDKTITTTEMFYFIATQSAICENPVLKAPILPGPAPEPTPTTTTTHTPPPAPKPVPPKNDDGELPGDENVPADQDKGTPDKPGEGPAGQEPNDDGYLPDEERPTPQSSPNPTTSKEPSPKPTATEQPDDEQPKAPPSPANPDDGKTGQDEPDRDEQPSEAPLPG